MNDKILYNIGKWSSEYDENGNCTKVSYDDDYRKLLGIDALGDDSDSSDVWKTIIHPDDISKIEENASNLFAKHPEGMDYDLEYRMMTKSGYHWFHDFGLCTRREDGSVSRMEGIIFDIQDIVDKATLQKARIEESLAFTNYFLSTYLAAYYVNLDTLECQIYKRTVKMEKEFPEITNYLDTFTEYIRRNVHPDDQEAFLAIIQPSEIKALLKQNFEYQHVFRDISHGDERQYRMQVICGADEKHAAFGFVDVTEEIREQQKHLLGAVPLSPDILNKANIGLWAFELDEGFPPRMYVDDTMLGLVGLKEQTTPEETYHAWYDHIDENSYALVTDAVAKMSSGEHAEVQYPWHHPDGRTLIVRCGGVRNPQYTKGIRIEGTHQNVTEVIRYDKEEAERNRKASEFDDVKRKMNMIFSLSDEYDPIIVITPESGEYDLLMSKASTSSLGTSIKLHGDSLYDNMTGAFLVHEEDREKCLAFYTRENMMKIAQTGEMMETENRWFIKDENKYRWKYNKAVRMIDDDGKAYVVVGVIDTTEAKEKEAEYQAQKKLIEEQQALSNGLSREYHTVWLMEGFGEHKMHLYRSTGVKTIKSAVQIALDNPSYDYGIKKYINEYVHEDDRERVSEATKFETIARETPEIGTYVVTYRRYNTDHTDFDYHQMCYARAVSSDGTVNFIFAYRDADKMMRDQIAQQKQLEEALSMAQSANRAKTTFLNNMSHDIRTPMNAIIGYTGLAASHIDNREQVQDYLSKISQSSDHLLSLINDVLDMSRIESGKMNLAEKPENLSDIIHTLRNIVQADIHSKQLEFFMDAVDVNDEDIICDKLRLNQVLLNILSNSIKYTPAGGTVTMRVTEKTVKNSGFATFEFQIKDNGMGMDEEFLKTIFDPFTRVRSSTVSGIQGTGLGMAITKNIIDMMGGHIGIASEPGKGTEVTVNFDFKLQSTPKAPEEIPELNGVRVLVADDDTNTCLSICNMVKDIGMRFEWCTSGREAIIRAEAAFQGGDAFKVYFIDLIMPDMNGIETARRIRKTVGEDIPIIILTAYDWSDIDDEAREAGVTAFISKPMFPSDLQRVLKDCIGKPEIIEKKPKDECDFAGRKVLLVEDNVLNREIAVELLSEYGFIIDTAEDGTIAVEKMKVAKDDDYDIVLMDIQMPIMNGYDATRAIRALGTPVSRIPILAMTADAFEEDRKLALDAGMNEHIIKPIKVEKLKEALEKFL